MAEFLEYRSKVGSKWRSSIWIKVIGVALVGILISIVGLPLLLGLAMMIAFGDHHKSVEPAEVYRMVTSSMDRWDGSILPADLRYELKAVRGNSTSGGIHGDGTDCYEVDLSPKLAVQLSLNLSQSQNVTSIPYLHPGVKPSWWPSSFPSDTQYFKSNSSYLEFIIISVSEHRMWFVRERT